MLYYLHTQTHNKYKDRTQTVLLTKPPNQRTNTCLTFRNMIIFCPKRNIMTFPEPQDTTHADEVCIATVGNMLCIPPFPSVRLLRDNFQMGND